MPLWTGYVQYLARSDSLAQFRPCESQYRLHSIPTGATYLEEALNEILWQPRFRIIFCPEVFQHVRELLPVIQRLLRITSSASRFHTEDR